MEEKVSIILPAYNSEDFIGEAITSVLNQTHTDWELIIINDGSTDATEKKIRCFYDPRVTYIYQTNQGVSAARNSGLKIMNGNFFCFLDADDVLPPGSLKDRLKIFAIFPDTNFVDGGVMVFDKDMSKILKTWYPAYQGSPFEELLRISESCFFGPTWMIRRQPLIHYSFDTGLTHGEDYYFYLSIAKSGIYRNTQKIIYHYRKTKSSAMSNLDALEKGYFTILNHLQQQLKTNRADTGAFRQKIKSIMFKSWIAKGNLYRATKVWFK